MIYIVISADTPDGDLHFKFISDLFVKAKRFQLELPEDTDVQTILTRYFAQWHHWTGVKVIPFIPKNGSPLGYEMVSRLLGTEGQDVLEELIGQVRDIESSEHIALKQAS